MKPIRIFRHIACEPPGYLADFLNRRGIPFEVVCIDLGSPVPQGLEEVSALVFMGGAVSVHDPLPWIQEEMALIRRAVAADVPVMGVCLGGQLMAQALGGEVTRQPAMEIGWHPVSRLGSPAAQDWLADLPETFTTFHWHAWVFSPPPDAEPLLTNECTPCQAFGLGPHLAMQFHLEMTGPMVRGWVQRYGSDLELRHDCTQDGEAMIADLPARLEALHRISDRLYGAWLSGVLERTEQQARRA